MKDGRALPRTSGKRILICDRVEILDPMSFFRAPCTTSASAQAGCLPGLQAGGKAGTHPSQENSLLPRGPLGRASEKRPARVRGWRRGQESRGSQGGHRFTGILVSQVQVKNSVGQPDTWPHALDTWTFTMLYMSFKKKRVYFVLGYSQLANNVVVVSGELRRDSATHGHVSILPQTLPSHPGGHMTFSRVPCAIHSRSSTVGHPF